MPPSEDKSYIEDLKKTLYSRSSPDVRTRRKLRFSEDTSAIKTSWEEPKEERPPVEMTKKYESNSMSFFMKLLIGSAIFCVIAVGAGAYIFFNGSNLISTDNIDIIISGPVSIPAGTPVSFDVTVTNKNNINLQLVDMTVNFPLGTTDPKDSSQTMQTYTKLIGELVAGSSAHESVSAIIFGEENLQKEIEVSVTYSVKGSSAVFTKKQTYEVLISSSPISLSASAFKEITSGQEFDMKLTIKSNSGETLKNILLKASYPFGYTFMSSDIKPLTDNATWRIGDLPAGASRAVTIHGKIIGEDDDSRVFRFAVGSYKENDQRSIGTQYMAIDESLTIAKPFVSLKTSIENDNGVGDYILSPGSYAHVDVGWFNNLHGSITNLALNAKLSGNAYKKSMIQPEAGFFNSSNNEIVWNQKTNSELSSVAAGDDGVVSFMITPENIGASGIVNPSIDISVSVSGKRAQESSVPESLSSVLTRSIKISSTATLSGRIVRNVGPFTNSGPLPPRAEQATTYTVIWDVDNTSNVINNTQVTATLPQYVTWMNSVSPTSENVSYDKNSGLVTWNVGNVDTYTLNSGKRREVAFQISFTPSVSQVGQSPTLVNAATLKATDSFTGASLSSGQDSLTIRFSTDPSYSDGNDVVAK